MAGERTPGSATRPQVYLVFEQDEQLRAQDHADELSTRGDDRISAVAVVGVGQDGADPGDRRHLVQGDRRLAHHLPAQQKK